MVSRRLSVPILNIFVVLSLLLAGCGNSVDFSSIDQLAKTDVDMVADTSLSEMNRLMRELLEKLYKRNPGELDKVSGMSIGQRQDQIFDTHGRLVFDELYKNQGTNAMAMAFHPDYKGDRVFALMVGLVGMVRSSYNWKEEQFMLDSLDAQKLFNSARNIEVMAWQLSNSKGWKGDLLLLSNSRPGEEENLSYERLFGKMIAIQDMMAFVVADKWDRSINHAFLNVVFLPMGL